MSSVNIDNIIDAVLWNKYFKKNLNKYQDDIREVYINSILSIIYKNSKVLEKNNITRDNVKNRLIKILNYRAKLYNLKKMPLIKQRTPEWYELRKSRLTASDAYDAIANNNLLLAKKKAGVYVDDIKLNKVPPIKWGTMFEDMAMRCYSQMNDDMIINEFGLIPDKELEHFGASPDGISEMGIMIEIKCPYMRKIKDGYIPPKYITQMQGQLAVCNLEECDYVECEFKQYLEINDYLNDTEDISVKNHGVIAEFTLKDTDEFYYIYSEIYLTPRECLNTVEIKINEELKYNNNLIFNKLIPWKLLMINVQRVNFNKPEWDNIKPKIINFWEKVENCKNLPIEYKKKKEEPKIMFINDDSDDEK
jgi:putative phage-type endonuclease